MFTDEFERYEELDSCYGVITGRCKHGAFIKLDNNEEAFAFAYSNLVPGTVVLCSILKKEREGKKKLVAIESVIEYALRIAV